MSGGFNAAERSEEGGEGEAERKGKEATAARRIRYTTLEGNDGAEVNPIRNGAREFLTLRRFHIMSHGGVGAAGGTYRTLTESGVHSYTESEFLVPFLLFFQCKQPE